MTRRYVVIGNGIAGQTCAEELRKLDAEASIVMIAAEKHPLYNRVALPRYLRGQVRREKVFMRTVEDYEKQNLEIHLETWVTEIDAADYLTLAGKIASVEARHAALIRDLISNGSFADSTVINASGLV